MKIGTQELLIILTKMFGKSMKEFKKGMSEEEAEKEETDA